MVREIAVGWGHRRSFDSALRAALRMTLLGLGLVFAGLDYFEGGDEEDCGEGEGKGHGGPGYGVGEEGRASADGADDVDRGWQPSSIR